MSEFGDDVDPDDLMEIGRNVVDMADRLKVMNAVCPGAKATLGFEVDGVRFELSCSIPKSQPISTAKEHQG